MLTTRVFHAKDNAKRPAPLFVLSSVLFAGESRNMRLTCLVAVASRQRSVCYQGGPARHRLERFPARVERCQADYLVHGEGERGREAIGHDHQPASQGLLPGVLERGGEGEASGASVVQGFHPGRLSRSLKKCPLRES